VKPSTLSRYLLEQNLFYLLTCLAVGVCLYLLSDLFDRLDDFLEAGAGLSAMLTYFLVKTPLILSQILPAVFLLSVGVQLSLMARSRELLALRAGGLSFSVLAKFFIVYSLVWCAVQFGFSQYAGVYGHRAAREIWTVQVHDRQEDSKEIGNVWFKEGDLVVEVDRAIPGQAVAYGITVYEMAKDRRSIWRMIKARSASIEAGDWSLRGVTIIDTRTFEEQGREEYPLALEQNLKSFTVVDRDLEPASLPLWQLSGLIKRLEASGSNVEGLRTAWHMNWAFSCSILALCLVALALATVTRNIYLNVVLGLLATFFYYGLFLLGVSSGQKGLMPPMLAAWFGNIVMILLAGGRLVWAARPARIGPMLPAPHS
jgi:lipopolysaccharide export system permease protein